MCTNALKRGAARRKMSLVSLFLLPGGTPFPRQPRCGCRDISRNSRRHNAVYKLQVQEDENDASAWHDVHAPNDGVLLFEDEAEARAKLEELFPILVKLEHFSAGSKRTRVLKVYKDDDTNYRH
jgi:hypothetical protein